ncbi:GntR family transcriptional regulator [Corynebacterium hindlerae]|uniref:GntR family transcriptional regulator n=1 Tax=Corynebacterium hindlerae TaxID=699041 RepID=UPI001AD792FA|nr:GntR family transcriptional regulator [Corynebacterium hindlerae]QTH60644.1 GntR family transcriptional regulator [Corynebacterium hindlerae]
MTATPIQLAQRITDKILSGEFSPGGKILEIPLATELGVSRNTLREAFRLLARDGLIEQIPHRGVFVRSLSARDIVELFAYRRFIELGALQYFGLDVSRTEAALRGMNQAITAAEQAARAGHWAQVGTHNNSFHHHLVSLAGIPRLNDNLTLVMAHARLAFLAAASVEEMHRPFIERNREILSALVKGNVDKATTVLTRYLKESEAKILAEMTFGVTADHKK